MTVPLYQLYIAGGGRQLATTAGTAIQVSTTSVPCSGIEISPVSTNTAPIVVGNSTALYTFASRAGYSLFASTGGHFFWCRDLNQVYMDGISTEGISYLYYLISES